MNAQVVSYCRRSYIKLTVFPYPQCSMLLQAAPRSTIWGNEPGSGIVFAAFFFLLFVTQSRVLADTQTCFFFFFPLSIFSWNVSIILWCSIKSRRGRVRLLKGRPLSQCGFTKELHRPFTSVLFVSRLVFFLSRSFLTALHRRHECRRPCPSAWKKK